MPFSGVTHTYTPEQGEKSLDLRRKIRQFLEHEGLSRSGVQELLSNRPLTAEADRRALQGLVTRLARDSIAPD
ncbi:MAG: hypothetical protein RQ847_02690 [Wenzhouxiangellaceae bacterium]|nr:hypothetical protein [Wenzhouxiangellaceae bacterium]